MEKIETVVPTLDFVAISGETLMRLKPDGVIEFGEKYRNNPDAAAQEFVRLVAKLWPELVEASASPVGSRDGLIERLGALEEAAKICDDLEDKSNRPSRCAKAIRALAAKEQQSVASVDIREELTERAHKLMQGRARYLEDQENPERDE